MKKVPFDELHPQPSDECMAAWAEFCRNDGLEINSQFGLFVDGFMRGVATRSNVVANNCFNSTRGYARELSKCSVDALRRNCVTPTTRQGFGTD